MDRVDTKQGREKKRKVYLTDELDLHNVEVVRKFVLEEDRRRGAERMAGLLERLRVAQGKILLKIDLQNVWRSESKRIRN
jgi:hypothetical protein